VKGDLTQAKLPFSRLLGVTVFAFALGVSINVLEPGILSHKILAFAPTWKNTALGLATFAGLIVAVLVQPIAGALSDRTRTRLGRRAPFLIGGTVLVIGSHFLIALSPTLAMVVIGLLSLQMASNTVQGPWQALIPDRVPGSQRGLAAGLKATFDILGFIVGRVAGGELISAGQVTAAAAVAAAAFAVALALTLWLGGALRDKTAQLGEPPALPWWYAFQFDWGRRPGFVRWFANRALFWTSVVSINTFILFFLVDVHGLTEPVAQHFVGQLGVLLGGGVLLMALPAGWLADRIGRRALIIASCLLAAAGVLILILSDGLGGVTAAAGVLGASTGVFLSGSWALVTDIVPSGQAARYLGLANIASAGGSALARASGGLLIDPIGRWAGSAEAGYNVVFGTAALALLLAAIALVRWPDESNHQETRSTEGTI
jgi:MFS family permease